MFIKTPQGKRCPFPDGLVVTEKPVEVTDSAFLRRRLKDGSVILTTKTQSPTPSKPSTIPKSSKSKQKKGAE